VHYAIQGNLYKSFGSPRVGLFGPTAGNNAMTSNNLYDLNKEIQKLSEEQGKKYYFGRYIPNHTVMFVAEMPTIPRSHWDPYDNFNYSGSDKMFMGLLNKYGFGGSYLTDIVKQTEKADRPTEDLLQKFIPILQKEIEIVDPKHIIAISNNVYEILNKHLFILNLHKITHPSYAFRYNKVSKLESELAELQKFIKNSALL
jgi:hypothetical protein